jgi:hypothetical protein
MILKLMRIWLVLFSFIIDDARSHEREVHHSIIHIKHPTRCKCIEILFRIYIKLNMFRVIPPPLHHQEPKPVLAASGFAYVEGCWTCSCWRLSASSNYTSNNPLRMQNRRLLVQF